jgi:DNA segregation ATPase FtsK/SpoIIIE and related proteins
VRLPRQQSTAIQQSTPGAISVTESAGDVVGSLVRGEKILGQLSLATNSLFIGGRTGSGKSTVARALLYAIHHADPGSEFYIVEPQSEFWLGLEKYRSIVRDCSFDELEIPAQLLAEVYDICQKRYKANRELVRNGIEPVKEHPIWLVINEWNNLYDTWNELPAKERQERGIDKMLNHARSIVRAGRSVNIRLILIGQEHSKEATGLSVQIKRSMSFISTGLILPDGNGGYDAVLSLITDTYLLAKHQREALLNVYKEAVKDRIPLLATTLGVPRLAELPDYSKAKTASIEASYRYKPIHEIHQQPLNLERMAR